MQSIEDRPSSLVLAFSALAFSTVVLALGHGLVPYGAVCTLAIAIQVGLSLLAWIRFRRLLSVCTLIIASWAIYFVVRMFVIMVATDETYDHVSVVEATIDLRAEVWVGATAGLAALVAGMFLGLGFTKERAFHDPTNDVRGIYRAVGFFCVAASVVSELAGVKSGILDNAFKMYLFCIAALVYEAVRRRRIPAIDVALILAAILLGPFLNFKEPAVMAVLAVVVGCLAAGVRVTPGFLVVSAVAGILVFTGVQAQRIAFEQTGTATATGITSLPTNIVEGLTQYDLARGIRREQSGLELIVNPINGVLNRTRGTDALFALSVKVPDQIPYQAGKSIIQPILVTIPVVGDNLDLEFTQLSLGRYYNYNFWTYRPDEDASSQALTMPGDLFLNGGWAAVVGGLLLLGALFGWLDRRFPARTAVGAGLFAYALLPLISLERGVAYQLVTLAIRLVLALIFIRMVGGRSGCVESDEAAKVDAPSKTESGLSSSRSAKSVGELRVVASIPQHAD